MEVKNVSLRVEIDLLFSWLCFSNFNTRAAPLVTLDLSNNELFKTIPEDLGFDESATILLSGNANL